MVNIEFDDYHMIEDEDYVLIDENNSNSRMDIDFETYSYKDEDDFVVFSVPCTHEGEDTETKNISKQMNVSSSVVSLEGYDSKFRNEIDNLLTKLENAPGDNISNFDDKKKEASNADDNSEASKGILSQPAEEMEPQQSFKKESKCGSRLSNKKRRKRLKMMKKAAAAAEAAALLEEMRQKAASSKSSPKTARKPKVMKSKKVHDSSSLAVNCVTESLNEYRKKHNL